GDGSSAFRCVSIPSQSRRYASVPSRVCVPSPRHWILHQPLEPSQTFDVPDQAGGLARLSPGRGRCNGERRSLSQAKLAKRGAYCIQPSLPGESTPRASARFLSPPRERTRSESLSERHRLACRGEKRRPGHSDRDKKQPSTRNLERT